MNRRRILPLLAAFGAAAPSEAIPSTVSAQESAEARHVQWVGRIFEQMLRIQPGTSRTDLLRLSTEQGGLSTRLQRTYVSRHCSYFLVDVTFRAVGTPEKDSQGRDIIEDDPRDKIITISPPYLGFIAMD